jgi:IS605 OrfB family transposase
MSVRTVALTLRPTPEQSAALERTRAAWVRACNLLSGIAWETRTFGAYDLQKIAYYRVREETGLLAQLTVRAIKVVCDSYRADKTCRHAFRDDAAMVLDTPRLYRVRATLAEVSTLAGRLKIKTAIGGYQRRQLAEAEKLAEADLIRDRQGRWRLVVACHYADVPEGQPDGYLGVDMGIKAIAATSDGTIYSGALRNGLRRRHQRLRARLQAKGTKGAKRLLRKRARKQLRFQSDSNHCISKAIILKAAVSGRGVAIEKLQGIRQRITARGADNRSALGNWAFAQLGLFLTYKAAMHGVRIIEVDPRNTSRTCPKCGGVDKANRKTQAVFCCVACGHTANADINAATVIGGRADAMLPNVGEPGQGIETPPTSFLPSQAIHGILSHFVT